MTVQAIRGVGYCARMNELFLNSPATLHIETLGLGPGDWKPLAVEGSAT